MRLILLLCLLPWLGWADTHVYVMRHGEKAADHPRDPSLAEAGQRRARALSVFLAERDIAAVYCSQFRRTCDTALPTAREAGLTPTVVPISPDIGAFSQAFAERLLAEHQGQAVLVVGHSNTVPALVAALTGLRMAPLAEDDYGSLFHVRIDEAGRAELERLRVGN
ncbi:phosphoglycerate mutase family protein [Gallaecimonas sp. GXIMD4217]|uniref:phosphoglycerate mutase family protein n=1 Tax=Gallaecimonas sp. GXIMD4217 TaxID=3131927 RepID=UPI00311B21A5